MWSTSPCARSHRLHLEHFESGERSFEPALGVEAVSVWWAGVSERIEMMADDKEVPAARDGASRGLEHLLALVRGGVEVGEDDEVEPLAPAQVVADVGVDDFDGKVLMRGALAEPGERHFGEVDRRHRPSGTGEPKAVTAFTRPEVDGVPGRKAFCSRDEFGIGLGREKVVGAPVAVVPVASSVHLPPGVDPFCSVSLVEPCAHIGS